MPIKTNCIICNKEIRYKPSHYKKITHHTCSRKCAGKAKSKYLLGTLNGNLKYDFDRGLFKVIDDEYKAYILGFIASDGCLHKNTLSITIHKRDIDILTEIKNYICKDLIIYKRKNNMITLEISSKELVNDICNILKINNIGKKSSIVKIPEIKEELIRHFIRGFFDGDGHIKLPKSGEFYTPECGISSNSVKMLTGVNKFFKGHMGNSKINWSGNACLDFLYKIYNNCNIKLNRKYWIYLDISAWEPAISYSRYFNTPFFKYSKTDKKAIAPSKKRASDSGYDLTIIKEVSREGNFILYDTGVKVCPIFGYYMMVVLRSSMSMTGYIMPNSIGIIDRSYVGTIKIPILKIDKSLPDLQLPARVAQMIPQKIQNFELEEVNSFEETDRGVGGFGSTNEQG